MDLNVTTMPFIIFVVYFSIWGLKKWVFTSDESRKNLPPVAAAVGCAVSMILYFFFPDSLQTTDIIECCTTGIASGLAAVGCNQVLKQYKKFNNPNAPSEEVSSDKEMNDVKDAIVEQTAELFEEKDAKKEAK